MTPQRRLRAAISGTTKESSSDFFHRGTLGRVIELISARQERDATAEAAWQRFVEATNKAKQTLDIKDGIAASKAYRAFLELFEGKR